MIRLLIYLSTLLIFFYSCSDKSIDNNYSNKKSIEADSAYKKQFFVEEPDTLEGIKFSVDDVKKNLFLLETFSGDDVFANFLGRDVSFSPTTTDTSLRLVPLNGSGLISTVNICYGQHRPLVLSPDIIWMTIAQGVTTHINHSFKDLESKIFKKNKPNVIRVRNDSLEYGARHWIELVSEFTDSVKVYTKQGINQFLAPTFTTTTKTINTAYQANILYGYKKAFTYVGEGGCGIPYITLTGSKQDWIDLKLNLKKLDDLELEYWRLELEPVLSEFISVFEGDININFWKNIYKEYSNYGIFAVSGWIIKLYPYMEVLGDRELDKEKGMYKVEYEFIPNKFLHGDSYLYSTLSLSNFPNYKSDTKILWIDNFKQQETKMNLYSGIMAAKQYDDGSLKPWVTWAISSENENDFAEIELDNQLQLSHSSPSWVPYIYTHKAGKDGVDVHATYPLSSNNNFEKSKREFKKKLVASLNEIKLTADSITFYVLANGKPEVISDNKLLKSTIQEWINKEGVLWDPAKKMLKDIYWSTSDTTKLVEVNTEVKIAM